MPLHPDWKEFLELLNSHEVDYLLVGAHALALHGIPRYTGDLDVLVRMDPGNAQKLTEALRAFGFESLGVTPEDFLKPGVVIQLGLEPYRIDILTSLTGIDYDDAWVDHAMGGLDGIAVPFLSIRGLRKNKLATGRTKDLADVESLLDRD